MYSILMELWCSLGVGSEPAELCEPGRAVAGDEEVGEGGRHVEEGGGHVEEGEEQDGGQAGNEG